MSEICVIHEGPMTACDECAADELAKERNRYQAKLLQLENELADTQKRLEQTERERDEARKQIEKRLR